MTFWGFISDNTTSGWASGDDDGDGGGGGGGGEGIVVAVLVAVLVVASSRIKDLLRRVPGPNKVLFRLIRLLGSVPGSRTCREELVDAGKEPNKM